MATCSAEASSNGPNVQNQEDENMRAATKRAPEGPAGDPGQKDLGPLAARQRHEYAASIQVCDSAEEQQELQRQGPLRALPAPGRIAVRRSKKYDQKNEALDLHRVWAEWAIIQCHQESCSEKVCHP